MSKIIEFYIGDETDSEGRTLEEILGWSDWAWESSHDMIQWAFPLTEASNFNPDAPILTEEDINRWNADNMEGAILRNNLTLSFKRFMEFLGLEWNGTEVKLAENFNDRMKVIWDRFNHNWLRVTRCLSSLRLLGLQREADALYARLSIIKECNRFPIRDDTFNFWTEAVKGLPFSRRLGSK